MDSLRCPPGDALVENLSGGEKRRVALCRCGALLVLAGAGRGCFAAAVSDSPWPMAQACCRRRCRRCRRRRCGRLLPPPPRPPLLPPLPCSPRPLHHLHATSNH
jgi:hypothetical protein